MKQRFNTMIIGSGCAGFNAADWLYDFGQRNIAIITEGINMGTSRNTGSDKQTYYKLSLAGDCGDSVREMAHTLFDGESVNGDTALAEAAGSVKAFMKLANMGVPFPTNVYGEYVGYKTDHDPRQRATSCGPLTSKLMTEALEKSVAAKKICIIDNMQVIKLICIENKICGLVAISRIDYTYHTFYCENIILASGGPAGVYYNSVYPKSQTGASGLALEIGAKAANLQEWQYGLASVKFRWNVSGTYQQVLPRYISESSDGRCREFLTEYFESPYEANNMVFLKGYQWPFDTKKIDGSSRIDMIIHDEITRGNRIYMDFTSNPCGLEDGFSHLSDEAYGYLKKSGALFGTPIERLEKMNSAAAALYKAHDIDLHMQPLEVAVCAQHCNGGIAVDRSWQSSVDGLYVVGEAAGTFGVYRPGGAALNSAQVGSMRAAEHIVHKNNSENIQFECRSNPPKITYADESNVFSKRIETQKLMSRYAAYIRNPDEMKIMYDKFRQLRGAFFETVKIKNKNELPELFKSYDILETQISVLSSMIVAAEFIGTRGSGLILNSTIHEQSNYRNKILITENHKSYFETVREIPSNDDWFENVWNAYNKRIGL